MGNQAMAGGRETFLKKVRSALGDTGDRRRGFREIYPREPVDAAAIDHLLHPNDKRKQELLDQLIRAGEAHRVRVVPVGTAGEAAAGIADLVNQTPPEWGTEKSVAAWRHPLVDQLNLSRVLGSRNVPVYVTGMSEPPESDTHNDKERKQIRNRIEKSYVGVTSAEFCLADTATLVLKTRPGQARSVSLVPSVHVAVITLDHILPDLKSLYTVLNLEPTHKKEGLTRCMTLITGPSKTGDIEMVLVYGAHGPREVHLFVITGR